MNTVKNANEVSVNIRVFQLIGSTKPFTTSAINSAPTFARPTVLGSRFMQVSQMAHCWTIAGTVLESHRLFLNCVWHMLISWIISWEYSKILYPTSRCTVMMNCTKRYKNIKIRLRLKKNWRYLYVKVSALFCFDLLKGERKRNTRVRCKGGQIEQEQDQAC